MKTITSVLTLTAVLCACAEQQRAAETYMGAEMEAVAYTMFDEGDSYRGTDGNRHQDDEGRRATATFMVKGETPQTYDIPWECDLDAAELRAGRLTRMRVDRWKLPSGAMVRRVDPAEVAEALCNDPRTHDMRQP